MQQWTEWMDIGEPVQRALDQGQPVLALESTIVTHGMPYPQNLDTAMRAEQAALEHGATPATIAIVDGRIKVGMSPTQIDTLASKGAHAIKTSRRDLPFVIASGACGGTTVAATMLIAALVNIRVFATGGIGGVHRGAQHSMDVSADLEELARTDVAVVCAGPKSILDIGLTLEYLETHGVAVIGFRSDYLPAFYTAGSRFTVDYRLDTAAEIAAIMNTKWSLGLCGGVVIANPVAQAYSLDSTRIEAIIEQASAEAREQHISGKELTPYLLQRVQELSGGDTLETNFQLMLNNAKLGARIAHEFSLLP